MTNEILVALITGGLSFLGVVVTNVSNNRKIQSDMKTQQAVTDTKIDELTREVRQHNNFAQRVPVLENKVQVADHRIRDLEDKVK
uniref:Uncharacterized protein n=1 Tax=Siphoviridae sp. ctdm01 TaxID=2825585 RepID=A0A8S5R3Z0_9CAUD|nr:MAG TPA: hypothetical protein [Siphoviridae sp. ctdm01]DAO71109.1 MAG TPA: hypothetical protein [Caudoviricetes sp.]DAU68141.1 MAG TPA: hypothetical protein [Caudoviricetes sp.]